MFNLREDDTSPWYVAMGGLLRRFSQKEFQDSVADIGTLPPNIDNDVDLAEEENERIDCERIYV